jgi:hypothetical protein
VRQGSATFAKKKFANKNSTGTNPGSLAHPLLGVLCATVAFFAVEGFSLSNQTTSTLAFTKLDNQPRKSPRSLYFRLRRSCCGTHCFSQIIPVSG